ncbi:RNAPII transcription regulator C-terminal-domain-containing protein [Dichotomocladium elegans]|nr:RNAPII transcription regulator C-terminal-domain-containing protein [Dichotomocladium elegans]
MDSIEREVTNYMISSGMTSGEATQAADNIVQAVNSNSVQANLLQLIQSMGEYLTNDDDHIRAKAIGLLSHTLHKCDHDSINDTAVSVLVDFYCERLTDKTCIPNLLDGLVALTEANHFRGTNAVTTATRIFERVDVQRHPQATRNMVFRIMENLLDRHTTALKAINNEFVYGFTQVMDGEKDPRNLMAAFKLVKTIIQTFDISAHVEDFFEVTFCYFPITFKPPPDDPYGITAEDLKQCLRECLSATGLFARLAVPLILEKLTSTSGSAKKDSMETIAACAPVYGSAFLLPVIDEVFDALKVEVFHSTDIALEDAALEAIRSIVSTVSSDATRSTADLTEKVLKSLVAECITNLKEPELKNAKPAGRILRSIISASTAACVSVVNTVVPLLLRQYRESDISTRKKTIMDVILELLEANKTLYGSADGDIDMDQTEPTPLMAYKDRFFAMFESALMGSNEYNGLRLSGVKGLELMVLSKNFLSANELALAVQSFNKILLDEPDEELRLAALTSLKEVSHIDTKYLAEQTVPVLIARLPDTSEEFRVIGYKQLLAAVTSLCPVPALFKAAIPALLSKFDAVCVADKYSSYPCAILHSILDMMNHKVQEKHDDIALYIQTLVPHLVKAVVQAALGGQQKQLILTHDMLDTIALIIMVVFEALDSRAQKIYLDSIFKLYMQGDLSEIGLADGVFSPFHKETSDGQKSTTQLFAAVLAACRKDVSFPVSSKEEFVAQLVDIALYTTNDIQHKSLARAIGSIVNKWKDAKSLTPFVSTLSSNLEVLISQAGGAPAVNALSIYLWITKALVLQASPLGYEFADKIISLCSSSKHGGQASQGFDIIIGDDKWALNKASFATIRLLYKQRLFNHCLPKLVRGFSNSSEEIKHNYLIAISYLLKNVPKQILLNELPPLVPLLIQSLSLPDTALKVSTLATFRLATAEAPAAIIPHVRQIIAAVIKLLDSSNRQNPMEVRIAALKCLGQLPVGLSYDVLKPYLNNVIKELVKSLDDKKRLVRREAVECRAKWYAIAV